jgi:hypothetical protein
MWRWRMRTRAWWTDLARPDLKTWVCRRRSKKSSICAREVGGQGRHEAHVRAPSTPARNRDACGSRRARQCGPDGWGCTQHLAKRGAANSSAGSPNQGVALEQPLRVLLLELEQLTGSATDFGQSEGDAPDLALVPELACQTSRSRCVEWCPPQAILASELELSIEARGLEGSSGDLVDLLEV